MTRYNPPKNWRSQKEAAIGRRLKVFTNLGFVSLDISDWVASLNLVDIGSLKGRRVECVNIECSSTIKIGWRMKNRCSSIGIQYIVPNIDPAGYDHPPLAIMNCLLATSLAPHEVKVLTLSQGVVYIVA